MLVDNAVRNEWVYGE